MKILIVDRSVSKGRLTEANFSFLKHLEFWHSSYNQIDVLARVDDKVLRRLKNKVSLIKLPKLGFLSLLVTYATLLFRSRKYDLVIEIWEKRPSLSLILNRKRSLIAIFGKEFRKVLPARVIKLIYRKTKFLVGNHSVIETLQKNGIHADSIAFIPDGVNTNKQKDGTKTAKKKNKILILSERDEKSVVSIISLFERKSLDWKFVILMNRKYVVKTKKAFEASELTSTVKIIPLMQSVFDKNLLDSKFLFITKDVVDAPEYTEKAFMAKTPVFWEGSEVLGDNKMSDLLISFSNWMDAVDSAMKLTKNDSEYVRLQEKISKTLKNYTWDEVGELSLKYIESL